MTDINAVVDLRVPLQKSQVVLISREWLPNDWTQASIGNKGNAK